jgi:glutathione S-transferase
VRWALEEAGLHYRVEGVPFSARSAEHFAHQPFAQVPWLTDGGISIFESGATLLHLAERSHAPMPTEPKSRGDVRRWLFSALNSVEAATLPWSMFVFSGVTSETPARKPFRGRKADLRRHAEAEFSSATQRTADGRGCEYAAAPVS